jgi:hypothetical protein
MAIRLRFLYVFQIGDGFSITDILAGGWQSPPLTRSRLSPTVAIRPKAASATRLFLRKLRRIGRSGGLLPFPCFCDVIGREHYLQVGPTTF